MQLITFRRSNFLIDLYFTFSSEEKTTQLYWKSKELEYLAVLLHICVLIRKFIDVLAAFRSRGEYVGGWLPMCDARGCSQSIWSCG